MNDENRFLHPNAAPGPLVTTQTFTTRRVLVIVAVVLALALLAWLLTPKAGGTRPPGGRFAAGGPMPVVGTRAKSGDMPISLIGLGAVTPLATVTVQAQIPGQIMKI